MSKTYRKYVKCHCCVGRNTKWYRERNKSNRVKNKHHLNDLLVHYHINVVDELFTPILIPRRDDWNEPTDGSWIETKAELQRQLEMYIDNGAGIQDLDYYESHLRLLKPKHRKRGAKLAPL